MLDQVCSPNSALSFEGEWGQVLELIKSKSSGGRKVYPGGGMAGVNATGFAAAHERTQRDVGFKRKPVDCYAVSVGGSTGLAEAYAEMRKVSHAYYRNFCNKKFIASGKLLPLLFGTKMSTQFYEQQLRELLKDSRVPSGLNRLRIGLTRCEDAKPVTMSVKFSDIDQTLALVRATASIPGLSEGKYVIDGVEYCDGMIADPLPIASALRSPRPSYLLVVMTNPESQYNATQGWNEHLYYNIGRPRMPSQLRSAILSRHERFLQELAWVRSQLQLPVGDVKRTLPPTCLVWPKQKVNMFETNPRVIKQALARSFRGWQEALL